MENRWGLSGPLKPGTVVASLCGTKWTFSFRDGNDREFMNTTESFNSAWEAKKAMREFCGVPLP